MAASSTEAAVAVKSERFDCSLYKQSGRYWMPHKKGRWTPVVVFSPPTSDQITVKSVSGQFYTIQDKGAKGIVVALEGEDDKAETHKVFELPPRNPQFLEGANDLTMLSYLHEPGILYNLSLRYARDDIYTRTGQILIALNPWRQIPELYDVGTMRKYAGIEGFQNDELPPHVYESAAAAYSSLRKNKCNQTLLVSGDSGAGKTETCKILMRFLAVISAGSEKMGRIEQRVLQSNPILEAFGNAKTLRNDNSSRFGKLTELHFDLDGRLVGANINTYLLEKNRVVHHGPGERSFHIFYQMCSPGALSDAERNELCLTDASSYRYLDCEISENKSCSDLDAYNETIAALNVVGVSDSERKAVLKLLAGLLNLGNVNFVPDAHDSALVECAEGSRNPWLEKAVRLFEVDYSCMESALISRKIYAGGEGLSQALKCDQACDARDALAKALYSRLFTWIVNRVNSSIHGTDEVLETTRVISILDIFGFEYFESNSFEQLCINFANEKIQQIFNQHIFKTEQKEYQREQIKWDFVDFRDNQEVVDLIQARPNGILDILEEECMLPKGSDESFVSKLHSRISKDCLLKHKFSECGFVVKHFAGDVTYDGYEFVEKNRDALHPDLIPCVQTSECMFIQQLFPSSMFYQESMTQNRRSSGRFSAAAPVLSADVRKSRKNYGSAALSTIKEQAKASQPSKMFTSTIGNQFKQGMDALTSKIGETEPHFIRCVKPNCIQRPHAFDNHEVAYQLSCGGVLEAVRIMRAMYPTRIPHEDFYKQFTTHEWKCLLSHRSKSSMVADIPWNVSNFDEFDVLKDACLALCQVLSAVVDFGTEAEQSFGVGRSKVFFRAGILARLEEHLNLYVFGAATTLRKVYVGHVQRRRFLAQKRAAMCIQFNTRSCLAILKVKRTRLHVSATRIQLWWRKLSRVAGFRKVVYEVTRQHKLQQRAKLLAARKDAATELIQRQIRKWNHERKFRNYRSAIIVLQSAHRGRRVRSKIKINKAVNVVESKFRLEHEVSALRKSLEESSKENSSLKDLLADTESEKSQLGLELSSLSEEHSSQTNQLLEISGAREKADEHNNRLSNELTVLRQSLEVETYEKETAQAQLEGKTREHQALLEDFKKLAEQEHRLATDHAALKKELEVTTEKFTGEVTFLNATLEEERNQKREVARTLNLEKGTVGAMSAVLTHMRQEIKNLKALGAHVRRTALLDAEQARLAANRDFAEKMSVIQTMASNLWNELELERDEKNDLIEDIERLEEQVESVVADLMKTEKALQQERQAHWRQKDEKDQALKSLAKGSALFSALQNRYNMLRETLESKDKEIALVRAHIPQGRRGSAAPAAGAQTADRRLSTVGEETSSKPRAGTIHGWARAVTKRLSQTSGHTYNVDRERILKMGWLVKEGRKRKTWKKRWFVLTAMNLSYYTEPDATKAKGDLMLESCAVWYDAGHLPKPAPKSDQPKQEECLKIATTAGRTLYVIGDTADSTKEWAVAINTAMSFNNYLKKAVVMGYSIDPRLGDFMETAGSAARAGFFLDNEPISLEALVALQQPLSDHTGLKILTLESSSLTDIHMTVIANIIANNNIMEKMYLGKNMIGDGGATLLNEGLSKNSTLLSLSLNGNEIGNSGASLLGSALRENTALTALDLGNNKIGDAGVVDFVTAIAERSPGARFSELQLSYNAIGNEGCTALGNILGPKNAQIRELHLDHNSVGDEGVSALSAALADDSVVEIVNLNTNNISSLGGGAIARMLQKNASILSVDLGSNHLASGQDMVGIVNSSSDSVRLLFSQLKFERHHGI